MTVAVLGLWHLGSVTAACLAAAGHQVIAFDPDRAIVAALAEGRAPIREPGLDALIAHGLQSGALTFTSDRATAVHDADVVWVTFDTPVDEDDVADVDAVVREVVATFADLPNDVVVLSSSQLPVGTVRRLELAWEAVANGRSASFACAPENLRLGAAIDAFTHPDRFVVGVRDDRARARIDAVLSPITTRIEWMAVESAEMTKHAVNAFLATSVSFINEVASLCEVSGADAMEVARGLRTERRIGPHAYLTPGAAFAGGTLARDISFLRHLGTTVQRPTPLADGVLASNTAHRAWAERRLTAAFDTLAGIRVAVWGLTYKPGTSTLRRSSAVETCRWLVDQGADVHVHDPQADPLPADLAVTRHDDPLDAVTGARALLLATPWPCYREIDRDRLSAVAPGLIVLDASRYLGATVGTDHRFHVITVGQSA